MASYGSSVFNTDENLPSNNVRKRPSDPLSSLTNMTQGTPLSGMTPTPGGTGFGSPVFSSTPSGPSLPSIPGIPASSTGGPIAVNPGQANALPGNTSNKNLQTVLGNTFNYDLNTQGALLNENEQALNLNNLQNTPLYKSNLATANQATTSAYDQAVANARRSAIGSGFGYASPLEQGGETAIRGKEAAQLASNPATALGETVGPELQAASLRNQEMSQFNPDALLAAWQQLVSGKSAASASLMSGLLGALGQTGTAVVNQNPGGVFGP